MIHKTKPPKLNREDIAAMAALKAGVSLDEMLNYMSAIESVILDTASSGNVVYLNDFGRFYVQQHKGHPIQFAEDTHIASYKVFKFSAAKSLNNRLRQSCGKSDKG